jgi:hypothetical protein
MGNPFVDLSESPIVCVGEYDEKPREPESHWFPPIR